MMQNEIVKRTLAEHRRALDGGEYTSQELTLAYLDTIEQREPSVGAYLTLDAERAMQAAREADERRALGIQKGALDGIPYALKDNFCTAGLRTTAASKMLENFVPPYDATVVARLREAGAILLGKLNMDEFAMGSTNENSALGITRNPLDPGCVTGGSSGGSAAAVAAYEAPFALGSDTGGSIRQPAAFCGVLGLKPTYGVLSRYGMIAMASSLDCVGIVTHTASDCAVVLSVLIGKDRLDATSRTHPNPFFAVSGTLPRLRVAVVHELLEGDEVSPAVVRSCKTAVELLRAHGAEIDEVSLPSPGSALASYCVLSAAEAASNMARFDGVRYGKRTSDVSNLSDFYSQNRAEGLGEEVKRRILFGSYMLTREKRAMYYDRARAARFEIRERMTEILNRYDLIINPTTPTGVFKRGEKITPEKRRRADLCAVYASLAGFPAVSVPFGRDENGMPLGIHLTAAPFREELLLRAASFFEEVGE